MELNALNTSLILAIGGIIARISDILKILNNILGFYRKGDKTIEIYKIESSNLKRTSNGRFGFSFIEPKTWDRFDPVNGDGNRYVHPTKSEIYISISGMHDVFSQEEIKKNIDEHIENLKKKNKFKLLLSRPSGIYCYDFPDKNTIKSLQVDAWRLKYKFKDKSSGKKLTAIELRSCYDRIHFTVYCQSESKDFEKYEDFFIFIISEFRILGEYSAPHAARNKK